MDAKTLKLTAEKNRKRLLEVIYNAGAGHTGGDLSCLNLLTVLYFHKLSLDLSNLKNPERDRFILSKGHCVEALFVVLEAKGILPKEELDTLGKFNSPLAGHPTVNVPGIEVNSGALGHGLSIGVGTALAAKMNGKPYMTYVLMGDGEQGEGSIYEAAMAGNQYGLDNLVAFIDRNGLQISGRVTDVMSMEPIAEKFRAFGWAVREIDGNDMRQIVDALDSLPFEAGKPSMVVAHTVKGKGVSFLEDTAACHFWTPKGDELERAKAEIEAKISALETAVKEAE